MNNKLYCTYYVLLLVSLFGSYCVGEMWSFHFPDPSEAEIRAIASNNEKILAAGIEGTLLQSLDGIRWEMCVSPLDGYVIFTQSISYSKFSHSKEIIYQCFIPTHSM
jgi:hypothetical protein